MTPPSSDMPLDKCPSCGGDAPSGSHRPGLSGYKFDTSSYVDLSAHSPSAEDVREAIKWVNLCLTDPFIDPLCEGHLKTLIRAAQPAKNTDIAVDNGLKQGYGSKAEVVMKRGDLERVYAALSGTRLTYLGGEAVVAFEPKKIIELVSILETALGKGE